VCEAYTTAPVGGTTTSQLQFFGHEEGRVRLKRTIVNSVTTTSYVVDYMLKDHLGNVRTTLTDEQQTDIYQATMETAAQSFETALFGPTIVSKQFAKPVGFDNNPENAMVARLRPSASSSGTTTLGGTPGSSDIGPGVLLKVMAGDQINAQTYFWQAGGIEPGLNNSNTDLATVLLSALTGNLASVSGGKITSADISANSSSINASITSFLNTQPAYQPETEKVYLSWILLDEQQLKLVQSGSGFVGVNPENFNPATGKYLMQANGGLPISIPKNGYLYVYISSEVRKYYTYFDDIRVEHVRGPLVEETQYYPFGLVAKGISSNAANKLENKRKFNAGSELESKEFSDGSGLELYSTFYRSLDPQIARFWQVDPKPDYTQNVYSVMNNNPISLNDPLGDTIIVDLFGKNEDASFHDVANTAVSKQTNDGVFLVYAHGHSGGIQYIDSKGNTQLAQTAGEFNKVMSERCPEYKQALKDGKSIILKLFPCNAASEEYVTHEGQVRKRDYTIAEKIADGLPEGSNVIAPDGYVWYGRKDGKPAILGVQQTTEAQPTNTNNGGFVTIQKNQKHVAKQKMSYDTTTGITQKSENKKLKD
jgi:RHS repeat-associated protein